MKRIIETRVKPKEPEIEPIEVNQISNNSLVAFKYFGNINVLVRLPEPKIKYGWIKIAGGTDDSVYSYDSHDSKAGALKELMKHDANHKAFLFENMTELLTFFKVQ